MSYHHSPITDIELSARRAICGWRYRNNYRATLQGYRSRGQGDNGWTIRTSHPRRNRYARSHAPRGQRSRHTHMVRDQLIATRHGHEYRLTRYRCGASSWHAALTNTATTICLRCAVAASGAHSVTLAS
jgi:hypothetical protein